MSAEAMSTSRLAIGQRYQGAQLIETLRLRSLCGQLRALRCSVQKEVLGRSIADARVLYTVA